MARLLTLLLGILVLAGCGDSSGHRKAAEKRQVTVPAYGTFHATTQPVTKGTPARCKLDAAAMTRDAVSFLTPSPTPVDLYFVAARTQFADYQAGSCDVSYLRDALSRRLTPKQRKTLVAGWPFLGKTGRELE
jgi:ABC-type oligopeptide transport system substrate-binding subunit